MTNTKPEWEAEFDSLFNWADQVKESETERWRLMYGLTPEQLKSFLKETVEKAERRGAERALEIAKPHMTHTSYQTCQIQLREAVDWEKRGYVCEQHPDQPFEHEINGETCIGPGMLEVAKNV